MKLIRYTASFTQFANVIISYIETYAIMYDELNILFTISIKILNDNSIQIFYF